MELINEDSPRRSLVNVRVGVNVRFFNFVNAYGCEIGDNTKVGSFVEIQKNARIGRNCKISSHSFICEGVEIGDGVFIGHNVSFINDKVPRATNPDGSLQTDADWKVVPTCVKKGAVDRNRHDPPLRRHHRRGRRRRRRERGDPQACPPAPLWRATPPGRSPGRPSK